MEKKNPLTSGVGHYLPSDIKTQHTSKIQMKELKVRNFQKKTQGISSFRSDSSFLAVTQKAHEIHMLGLPPTSVHQLAVINK